MSENEPKASKPLGINNYQLPINNCSAPLRRLILTLLTYQRLLNLVC